MIIVEVMQQRLQRIINLLVIGSSQCNLFLCPIAKQIIKCNSCLYKFVQIGIREIFFNL